MIREFNLDKRSKASLLVLTERKYRQEIVIKMPDRKAISVVKALDRLVRRWIKKGDDIGKFTKQDIRKINDWINQYPRKMFKGLSSQEMLVQHE